MGTPADPSGKLPHGLALTIYAPVDGDQPSYPVLAFMTGFAGSMAVEAYSEMLKAIAARGVVVVGADHKMNMKPDYPQLAQDLRSAIDWCATNNNLDTVLNGTAHADLENRLVVGAQSAGNHVTVQMLEHLGCGRAKGLFMLDPVDGYDPFGIVKDKNVIKGNARVNFSLPALHVETGMDPVKANLMFPPCAPPELSNDHFYDAFRSSPIWQINATAFGHLDCTDSGAVDGMKFACPGNKGGAPARATYHTLLAGVVGSFIDGLFDADGSFAAAARVLEDTAAMPVAALARHNYNGANPSAVKGGCTHRNVPGGTDGAATKDADVGANGFTCAMCKRLLPFVGKHECASKCESFWPFLRGICNGICQKLIKWAPGLACKEAGYCK